jgi:hypothetical protein
MLHILEKQEGDAKIHAEIGKGTGRSQQAHRQSRGSRMDRREVCMLTTLHKNVNKPPGKNDRGTSQPKMKPHCIIEQ